MVVEVLVAIAAVVTIGGGIVAVSRWWRSRPAAGDATELMQANVQEETEDYPEEDAGQDPEINPEGELEENEWTILEILAVAGGEQVGNHAIEHRLSDLSAIRVRHHLDRLVRMGLIDEFVSEGYMPLEGGDRWYELTPEGREFAVEHDLDE